MITMELVPSRLRPSNLMWVGRGPGGGQQGHLLRGRCDLDWSRSGMLARWFRGWSDVQRPASGRQRATQYDLRPPRPKRSSRKRRHWQARGEKAIRVGDQTVRFAREATRWLGIWLDSAFALSENRRRRIGKTDKPRQDSRGSPASTGPHRQQRVTSRWRSSRTLCCTHQSSPGMAGAG